MSVVLDQEKTVAFSSKNVFTYFITCSSVRESHDRKGYFRGQALFFLLDPVKNPSKCLLKEHKISL